MVQLNRMSIVPLLEEGDIHNGAFSLFRAVRLLNGICGTSVWDDVSLRAQLS
jgi:hypothetical protein